MSKLRLGVYPGTFNPFTIAHLAIAEAAVEQHDLDRLHLAISTVPLVKGAIEAPTFEHRIHVLGQIAATHSWLEVVLTHHQLLADIADGFDLLVMGADKWHQIQDPVFYDDDPKQRDEAMSRLPPLALAPRPPLEIPSELKLDVEGHIGRVSSTAVRAGRHEWMHPIAAAFDQETGAWSDPDRYRTRFTPAVQGTGGT